MDSSPKTTVSDSNFAISKTSFINDTITTTDFCEGEKSLLIVSEQGEVEYNQEEIEACNCDLVYVNSEDEWTYEFFEELKNKYNPTQVLVELNGMFNVNRFLACSKPCLLYTSRCV